ncbi:retrovirus-related Pol polyprotein from type-1 retrotransposable element R2, partial [Nephila pilipes]
SFLVWLDISNAFGSIPHNILFAAMASVGIDPEFIQLITNIYANSSTNIISNEGLTDPIPLRCGVKQGCPLSGSLFNISINHILEAIQDKNASRKKQYGGPQDPAPGAVQDTDLEELD